MGAKKKTAGKTTTKKATPRAAEVAPPAPLPVLRDTVTPAELLRHCLGLATLDRTRGHRIPKHSAGRVGARTFYLLDRGNGDELHVVWDGDQCLIWGFDHESELSPWQLDHLRPGLYAGLPASFADVVVWSRPEPFDGDLFPDRPRGEPRFLPATCARWWSGSKWQQGTDDSDDGGFRYLFGCLDPSIDFESCDRDVVLRGLRGEPLTDDDLRRMNPSVDLAEVRRRQTDMGYGR